MTFVSHARNFEDVMLWRALRNIEQGKYIDVGAASPDEHSVTKAFYERRWSGINIASNPSFHHQLKNQRPRDINLHAAVGESVDAQKMYLIQDTETSSLDSTIVDKHVLTGWRVKSHNVETSSLKDICKLHIAPDQEIHFLKIDVEGREETVLHSNDWLIYRPWIVLIEATLPIALLGLSNSWEKVLLDAKYRFVHADGLNRFYLAEEHAALATAFTYPPNVLDSFVQVAQLQAEARIQKANTEFQKAEAKARQAKTELQRANANTEQANIEIASLHRERNHLLLQLREVHNSSSWRITGPLRWPILQWRLLRTLGIKLRTRAFAIKLRSKIAPLLDFGQKQGSREKALTTRTQTPGKLPRFNDSTAHASSVTQESTAAAAQNNSSEPAPDWESPRERMLHKRLQQALEDKQRKQD